MILESRIRAGDLFDQLKREAEQTSRSIELRKNPALREMMQIFETSLRNDGGPILMNPNPIFGKNVLKQYNAMEIEQFSLVIPDEPRYLILAGFYLSALVNACSDNEITVHTQHLESIDHLGYNHDGKTLICKGIGGSNIGHHMKSGRIIVEGDAELNAGTNMLGGILEIYGNAGKNVGILMTGGVIYLHSKYESISEYYKKGEIYHKGKLIVKDGKWVK